MSLSVHFLSLKDFHLENSQSRMRRQQRKEDKKMEKINRESINDVGGTSYGLEKFSVNDPHSFFLPIT